MDIDTITIVEDGINKTIYPLLEFNQNNKKFLYYLEEIKNKFSKEDVFIAEITSNNKIIPISNDLLNEFNQLLEELITKY